MDLPRAASAPGVTGGPQVTGVQDARGRGLRDLRISVTDRCNFRCRYCMPLEVFGPDFPFLARDEVLSFEEIERVARAFVAEGVTKLRITGGEPLLRRDLPRLVTMLATIPGVEDLALTTNGTRLARWAGPLADAGLGRVTVSLDALDDATFGAMNGVGARVAPVLEGIEAAAAAGLGPVKVNMVVKRGVNEHSVLPMAAYFRERGHTLRFIEFMDVGTSNRWRLDDVVAAGELRERIAAAWPLEPVAAAYPGEVAGRHRYLDGAGEIGFITSVTQPFCGGCTRARISADGRLYTCLFASTGHDLRVRLRGGASHEQLRAEVRRAWGARVDRYSEVRAEPAAPDDAGAAGGRPRVEMSFIGG